MMTRTARLAHLFRRAPGLWFDGRELATVAGVYGWRSRVSDVRRQPYCLQIENRQRIVKTTDGTTFTVSEYRLVAEAPARAGEAAPWELTP